MDIATIGGLLVFGAVLLLLGLNYLSRRTALWLYSYSWGWRLIEIIIRLIMMPLPCRMIKEGDKGSLWHRAWMLVYLPNSGFIGEILYIDPEARSCIYNGF